MAASIHTLFFARCGHRNASLLLPRCCLSKILKSGFHSSDTVHDTDTVVPSMISPETKTVPKAEKISRAMRAYLERGKAYDTMISKEVEEYEIGKRHLARIMGDDPDSFSQEDIDRSIEYLLPSGLFNIGARPKMKHPSEVFPPQKSVQFDRTGRPFHSLFYTGMPNYYQIMHDAAVKYETLRDLEEAMRLKGITVPPDSEMLIELKQTSWLGLEKLQEVVLEKLDEHDLRRFQVLMERLSQHPLAHKEREFIMRFRKPLISQGNLNIAPPILKDEEGREYTEFTGKRKDAVANIKLWAKGSGKILVNGSSYQTYFPRSLDREQLLFPLQFVGRVGTVDVEATVSGGGPSGQAGAVRHGLSHCLTAFVHQDTVERMRIVGLLTRDVRRRERKKPGQPKARKKNTWKKR